MNKRWDERPTRPEVDKVREFLQRNGVPMRVIADVRDDLPRREIAGLIRAFLRTAPKANP